MTHATVLVVVPDAAGVEQVEAMAAKLLAPYDENLEVAPYRHYLDDHELNLMWGWLEEKLGHAPTLQELAEAMPDWNGVVGGVDEEGKLYRMSTYNRDVYQFDVCEGEIGGQGGQMGKSTGDEILSGVSATQSADGISEVKQERRRSLRLLHDMHEDAEQQPNTGTSAALACQTEISDDSRTISSNAEATEGSLRDLQSDTGEVRGGPRPSDGSGEGSTLSQLQLDAWDGKGQLRRISCGNSVPHGVHIVAKRLIGGARWDWYQVGGRSAGDDYAQFAVDPAHPNHLRAEGFDIRQITWTPYSVLTPDGVWHAQGRLGWFGLSVDAMDDNAWTAHVEQLLAPYQQPGVALLVVDYHI